MEDLLLIASTAAVEATAPEHSQSLFSALGIDWKLLIEQALAFLILVFLLGKFVYPALMKAVDDRREQIEAGMKEAKEAEEALGKAEEKVAEMLAEARKEADDMLTRTQQEANTVVADAEEKAKTRADQIVAEAREQLDRDVRKAREALKKDTVELVALATEKIVGEKLDTQKDAKLITQAIQEKA